MIIKTPRQKEAIQLLSDPNIVYPMLEGGSRSGKTFIILYAIFVRALKCKSRHISLRKHLAHIVESIWLDTMPKVLELLNKNFKIYLKVNNSKHFIIFPNGSEYWIGGLDDKDRTEKILGKEFSTIHINETSEISYRSLQIAKTRLAQKTMLKNKLYCDQNPPKKNHWTYLLWHKNLDPVDRVKLNNFHQYKHLLMNPKDNINNIGDDYLEILENMPKKERERFLNGKYGDEHEGKVFKTSWIERCHELLDFDKIVIALDPAVTSKETSDEFGIIVCARRGDFGYVLEDKSGIYTPKQWAKIASDLFEKWEADKVIGEVNNGGDLVEAVLRNENQFIPYESVRATRGKVKRAEPVAGLYEKSRIYHFGFLHKLEEEMVEFDYEEDKNSVSPNRIDATVWGFSYLFGFCSGNITIRSL